MFTPLTPFVGSVLIFLVTICSHCFHIMMMLAQSLPVTLIPEKPMISSVRNDMIYNCRKLYPAFLLALYTQRVTLKVPLPGHSPSAVVTTCAGSFTIIRMHALMFITVFRSIWHEPCTARMLTRCRWTMRHTYHSLHNARHGERL